MGGNIKNIAIIAPSPVPFGPGGAETLMQGLYQAFQHHTPHNIELIKLPTPERTFVDLMASYRRFAELDVSHFDVVITAKYPAWMVCHPHHIVYMLHTLRGVYDAYERAAMPQQLPPLPDALAPLLALLQRSPSRDQLPELWHRLEHGLKSHPQCFDFPGPLSRAVVHHLDRIALMPGTIRHYAAISRTVAARRDYFPAGVAVDVIHPPSGPVDDQSREESVSAPVAGPYVFTASRLDAPKRLDFLIRAWRRLPHNVPLFIAGDGPQRAELQVLADQDPRVTLLGRVPADALAAWYRHALFVPFVPDDEDYGLITLEAMRAGKAVVTVQDSGGVNELVVAEETGLSVPPTEPSLCEAMARLLDNPQRAKDLGQAAKLAAKAITWQHTIQRLCASVDGAVTGGGRKQVLVVATFPAWPVQGGGQQRLYALYKEVAHYHDVTLLCLGDQNSEQWLAPGYRQIMRAYTDIQHRISGGVYNALSAEISDVTAGVSSFANAGFMAALERCCKTADVVIACHPFLHPQVRAHWAGPLIYEAHDVEYDVKRSLLDQGGKGRLLHRQVAALESQCVHDSVAVAACSADDLQRFAALYGVPASAQTDWQVVPNGVDVAALPYRPLTARRERLAALGLPQEVVLFMGSRHPPNVAAAKHVLRIAQQLPHVAFWIMGSVCAHPEVAPVPANVSLLGMVDEPVRRAVLGLATIALNPMEAGSGTNLKMLDYTASGLEVVTTPFGNRGLGFDQHAVHVAESDDFAARLQQVMASPVAVREHLTAHALAHTHQQFCWARCAAPLLDQLAKVFEHGAR